MYRYARHSVLDGPFIRGETGLAYRLLGSAADAEDALQTAFERWLAAGGAVAAPAAWLTTVV
jgi:DNA-directed RNA polymerase specialized sigma24 family protein